IARADITEETSEIEITEPTGAIYNPEETGFEVEANVNTENAEITGIEYFVKGEDGNFTTLGENKVPVNAGTYKATVTIVGIGNYTSEITVDSKEFTVARADITGEAAAIVITEPENSVYNPEETGFEVEVTVNDKTAKVVSIVYQVKGENGKFTAIDGKPVNAGTYKAVVTVEGIGNYTNTCTQTSEEFTVSTKVITEDDITVTVPTGDDLIYTGTAKEVTAQAKGDITATILPAVYEGNNLSKDGKAIDVGTYTAKISVKATGNYSGEFVITREFTIQPKEISTTDVTVTGTENLIYDKTAKELTVEFKEGITGTSSVVYTGEGLVDGKPVNAGKYTAVVTITGTNNYTGTKEIQVAEYTIAQRDVKIEIDNQESVYGDEIVEDLTYTVEENVVIEEDDLGVQITTTATSASKVGANYTITGTISNNNYKADFTNGTYTITVRPITIKADDASSQYGESRAELTYSITSDKGLVNGDTITNVQYTTSVEINEKTPLGDDYVITVTATINDNYDITFLPGTYTVGKRIITIKANNAESIYGNEIGTLGYTVISGKLLEGDTIAHPSYRVLNDKGNEITISRASVGEYELKPYTAVYNNDGEKNDNYEVHHMSGVYTITPRPITIKANDAESTYGSPRATLGYTVTSDYKLVNGDTIENVQYVANVDETTPVGEYPIKITSVDISDNYEAEFEDGTYTVNPKAIDNSHVTIELPTQPITYDKDTHEVTVNVDGNVADYEIMYSEKGTDGKFTAIEGKPTNAGTYKATVTLTGKGNYTGTATRDSEEYTIEKARPEFTVPTGLTALCGDNLVKVKLPEGFEFEDDIYDTLVGPEGANEFTVTYTPKDTRNYITVTGIKVIIDVAKVEAYDISDKVKFDNKTVNYNGREHTIEVSGLPAGVEVTYTKNNYTNAGTYVVTAVFNLSKELQGTYNTVSPATMQATLTINKIPYALNMNQVKFESATVDYDGATHEINVTGLPEGITVTYAQNSGIAVGTYYATATFGLSAELQANYSSVSPATLTSTLVIENIEARGIRIITPPTAVRYGDKLDFTNAKLEVSRANGSTKIVPITENMITRYDSQTLNEQTITVTYAGFTDKFTIKLQDYVNGILAVNNGKVIYERDEEVDISGIEVWKVTAAGRRTEQITDTSRIEIIVPSTKNSGAQAIKVIYTDNSGKVYTALTPITVKGTQIYYYLDDDGNTLKRPLVEDETKFAYSVLITWSSNDKATVNGVPVQKGYALAEPTGTTQSLTYNIVVGEGKERVEKTIVIEIIKPTAKIEKTQDGTGYEFIFNNVDDIATAETSIYYYDTDELINGHLEDLSNGELQEKYVFNRNGYYIIRLLNKLGVDNTYEFEIDNGTVTSY
ncbi:MAG: hypothetical protein HFJ48_03055, partial [Clostridia bacterium]|nr:hypothetical protein [Clostridia bacterium]